MQLVEKLCSLSFTSTEWVLIAEHIQLFFSKYVKPFDDVKLKPKACFIFHYPHVVRFDLRLRMVTLKVCIAIINIGKICQFEGHRYIMQIDFSCI